MSLPNVSGSRRVVDISTGEVTGALGDSVTVLPIVVALGATTEVSLPHVLALFGVFQVVWGLTYGLPLSVEPMKALAGLAVAGAITYPELAAAGLLAGATLLVVGRTGVLSRLAGAVGDPAIRGVQLAVALLLLRTGFDLALSAPAVAAGGVGVAALVALAGYRRAGALAVLGAGGVLAVQAAGVPAPSFPTSVPVVRPAFTAVALQGTVAQLAMTVGNAAVATSLLCSDLFDADVSPDRLAGSMGATCLVAVPLGGIPMCHGSGGLEGKHAFGARTGGANLVLGGLYLAAATVAGAGLLAAFPLSLMGVLLGVIALELGRTALRSDRVVVVVLAGVAGAAVNVALGLVLGAIADAAVRRARSRTADPASAE